MPQKNPKVDYLRVYPGLNDFSDALESIPQAAVSYLTHIKEVDAKIGPRYRDMTTAIEGYFTNRNTDTLLKINQALDVLLPAMNEKMQTAALAAKQVSRQVDRLNADYDMIRAHEIPSGVQFDPNDPAFYEIVPQDKVVNARTQARREAREARETRRNTQQQESRSITPAVVPDPPATSSRRRGRTTTPQAAAAQTSTTTNSRSGIRNGTNGSVNDSKGDTKHTSHSGKQELELTGGTRRTAALAEAAANEAAAKAAKAEAEKPHRGSHGGSRSNQIGNHLKPEATIASAATPSSRQTSEPAGDAIVGLKRKRGPVPKTSEPVYCYCEQGSFGEMVGCDGPQCEREWFHLGCIGLSAIPKGQWFCEECRAKLRRR